MSSVASRVWMMTGRSRFARQLELPPEDLLLNRRAARSRSGSRARSRRAPPRRARRARRPAGPSPHRDRRRAARPGADGCRPRTAPQATRLAPGSARSTSAPSPADRITIAPARPALAGPRDDGVEIAGELSPARWQWESIIDRCGRSDGQRRSPRVTILVPAARPDRSRPASACRRPGSRRGPCRSTRCPSASPASG